MSKENVESIYRLSPVQQGMLFHILYAPGEGVYFEVFESDFGVHFDPTAFERVWQELVDRSPVLRTSFVWEGLEEPVQIVHRQVKLPFSLLDWRGLPAAEQSSRLEAHRVEERRLGFNLLKAPLIGFSAIRLRDDLYRVICQYSHLVLDGWSFGLLFQEVDSLYPQAAAGRPLQGQQRRPFRDYVNWLRQQDLSQAEGYWRRMLGGFTTPTPLGVDRPAGRGREDLGRGMEIAVLPEAETEALKAWAKESRLTLSTVAQGAWALVLSRYSGEEDLVFGLTVSGRPPGLPGMEAMLGCFINTLPLRVRVPAGARALSWLQEIQTEQVEMRRYEHSPLVDVLGWSDVPRPTPLFESIFVFEGFVESLREGVFQRTNYPLTLVVGPDREMVLRVDYERERFEAPAVERLLGHWKAALLAFAADRRLEEIDVLQPAERQQLLTVWNRAGVDFPSPLCLHEIFESQAARTPGAPAVTFEGESRGYAELNARANRVAHRLRRLGVGPESRVGLCVDRSFELVEGLLGILKAGGAYVPLDPRYPTSRLSYIAEDSRIEVLVTTEELRELVPGVAAICLSETSEESAENPEPVAGPDNLAYVIYTSGSTGKPKGSLITHRNVARLFSATGEWFHFGPEDVWSLFHSFAFDFSVWEIWGALLYGGRLVVVPYWVSRSPEAFHELLVREKVTVLNQTPSAFRQLAQADGERGGELALRYVVFGGEALELSSLAPWFDRHGDEKPLLVNMYGITETTVHVTYRVVRRADLAAVGKSPVGVPIPDLCVHLRDRHGNLVPAGVAGEMYVAGAGVARGYLGRPELTAERFVPDPFGDSGERLYRSGDLARWLDGGDLEYLGRIDHQVKIRGFRIELGEIEAVLGSHPSVREAVVLPREDDTGDRRLVGYVVPRESGIDAADLREYLKDRLPDYMIPSALVEIPAVPLTAHGKVDRKALPDPAETVTPEEKGFDPPRTPTEELVAGIWSEVLRVERVGRGDSFFDLGGHSLLATRVLSRLREVLGVDLPLRVLFESPTVAEMAPRVEAARAVGGLELPPLVPGPRDGDLPLSFSQERLWFLEQLQPGTAVYHIPNAVRMTGTLDVAALRRALAEVVRRHESLRTVFSVHGGRPVQVVREDLRPALPLLDLSGLSDPKDEIRRVSALISRRPFNLGSGPLLRLALLKLDEGEHVLLLTFHHIVSDAWSLEVLLRELGTLYAAFSSGRPSPLPELPVQYADFALWQRSWLHGEVLEALLAYWREGLAGVPVLQLPGDRPRPALQSYHGSMVPFALPEPLSAAVHALARAKGATVFMILLSAYEALLARYSGQEDFAVGSPVAGRDRREIEGLIGFFINTLVLRSSLAADLAAAKLLDRVRAVTLEGYARQSVPFERIVQELAPERNLSYSPLFQVMLAFQSLGGEEGLELPGLTLAPQSDDFPVSKFDLTLTAFDSGSQIFGHWVYSTALFDRETVERWSGHFQVLLEGLVADPARRVSELPLLTAGEREQILVEWNRPPVGYPEEGFVHQLFEAQVEKTPDAVAVVFEGESLTYRELNARANRLARHLRRRGAGPEVLVGIRAERSFEMVVGLLAILKAGSAYLPLDPSLPEERLSYMMEDAGIGLLVTQDLPDCSGESEENLSVPVLPDNSAYVIYTSGSTGRPKGVVVSHRALGNRLQYARAGDVNESDAFLQKTTIGFDVSLAEIFAPLVNGGRTVLARPGGQQDPEYLVRLIREQRITYASFPPSLLYVLFEQEGFDRCGSLRVVITGGETVPAALPGQLYRHLPGASLFNRYGPTETTISVTSWLCERDVTPRTLPIGRPTAKARVYLLGPSLQPVPAGVTGEIFLGGTCVA
ncbi:MAG: amino acid adenylation domain-containing protein, partial [Thermoanaerobaculia bacterium]